MWKNKTKNKKKRIWRTYSSTQQPASHLKHGFSLSLSLSLSLSCACACVPYSDLQPALTANLIANPSWHHQPPTHLPPTSTNPPISLSSPITSLTPPASTSPSLTRTLPLTYQWGQKEKENCFNNLKYNQNITRYKLFIASLDLLIYFSFWG